MAKSFLQTRIVLLLSHRRDRKMKTLFAIVTLAAAGLVSSGANADTVHHSHRAGVGIVRHMPAASFQSFYQGSGISNDCEGRRVFGVCPVR